MDGSVGLAGVVAALGITGGRAAALVALVPIDVGLTAAVRQAGVPSRWLPLVALAFGIVLAGIVILPAALGPGGSGGAGGGLGGGVAASLISGLVVGLSASGAWSQGKTLASGASSGGGGA